MKIGSKIALFYTLLSVLTTIIIIAVFYLFSTQFINKLYASYLREKAYLTAQKHWEKDEVDEQSYQIIQRKYDELLPEAHEILLNMDSLSEVRDTLNKYLTQHQQALLIAGEDSIPFSFKYKDQLGAALYYPDNEGNFIVLVMSRNVYGAEIKEHLLLLSIFLVLFSSILIYLVGKIYSGRILVPLQHILKELKRIRANSLNRRLRTTGNNDELEDMIKTLNSMLDRLDSAFKAEKSFVSHASHELTRHTGRMRNQPAERKKYRRIYGSSATNFVRKQAALQLNPPSSFPFTSGRGTSKKQYRRTVSAGYVERPDRN